MYTESQKDSTPELANHTGQMARFLAYSRPGSWLMSESGLETLMPNTQPVWQGGHRFILSLTDPC